MRILWLSGNSALYRDNHVNGGWIAALQREFVKINGVTLAIAFPVEVEEAAPVIQKDGVDYFPVLFQSWKIKILRVLNKWKADKEILKGYIRAVNLFKPDIIHVWGSELEFGLISEYTDIPVVLHIQGLINPIVELRYPNNVSMSRLLLSNISVTKKNRIFRSQMRHAAEREKRIMKKIKYMFGRTEWDKTVSGIMNKDRVYFYCSELLREPFFTAPKWHYGENSKRIVITSVINGALYKGGDVILKTANVLKEFGVDFIWNVIGVDELNVYQELTKINPSKVNVRIHGRCKAEEVISILLGSDVFVHLSYIENSPNCVCEAQMLGIPIIATGVGGTPTIVKDGITGFIVSTNDPYNVAGKIGSVKHDKALCELMSTNEIKEAKSRHNKEAIVNDLLNGYKMIIEIEKHNI